MFNNLKPSKLWKQFKKVKIKSLKNNSQKLRD